MERLRFKSTRLNWITPPLRLAEGGELNGGYGDAVNTIAVAA